MWHKKFENLPDNLKEIANLIKNGKKSEIIPLKLKSDFKPVFSREKYCEMVLKAKNYIYATIKFDSAMYDFRNKCTVLNDIHNNYEVCSLWKN